MNIMITYFNFYEISSVPQSWMICDVLRLLCCTGTKSFNLRSAGQPLQVTIIQDGGV